MKRLFRFFSFVGGVGAVVWLLRDRLVSVTTSREPEPPRFAPEPPSGSPVEQDDLTQIKGIGPTYTDRLNALGITTFGHLASSDAADLGSRINVSESRVAIWIELASQL